MLEKVDLKKYNQLVRFVFKQQRINATCQNPTIFIVNDLFLLKISFLNNSDALLCMLYLFS